MEICSDCQLPKTVCSALEMYRKACGAYESDNLGDAREAGSAAAAFVSQYKAQRGSINRITLSDSDRLRLSG
jgi:hypothetical protein